MKFGFLTDHNDVAFDDFVISPLPDHSKVIQWAYENVYVGGGWIHPPPEPTPVTKTPCEQRLFAQETILRARYFRLPATHSISTLQRSNDAFHLRFLIIAYGFLHGMHLIPEGHLYSYKTPHETGKLHSLVPYKRDCEIGMQLMNSFYCNSNATQRKLAFSALHTFLISASFDLLWDHFDAQYKALDCLYRLMKDKRLIRKVNSHAERPLVMADHYKITLPKWAQILPQHPGDNKKNSQLSILRNELVHEALWAQDAIGYSHPEINYRLEFTNFTTKLLCGTFGLKTSYMQSAQDERPPRAWDLTT